MPHFEPLHFQKGTRVAVAFGLKDTTDTLKLSSSHVFSKQDKQSLIPDHHNMYISPFHNFFKHILAKWCEAQMFIGI